MTTAQNLPITVNNVSFEDAGLYNNYFRTSEIRPEMDGETLTIINGKGDRRSWGCGSVDSRVSMLTDDIIQVEVTGWHKWTVSPVGGNYYFVRERDGKWTRRTANYGKVKAALAS